MNKFLERWGLAHSVLSAGWSHEDHGEIPIETLLCVELFKEMDPF